MVSTRLIHLVLETARKSCQPQEQLGARKGSPELLPNPGLHYRNCKKLLHEESRM